MMRSLASLTLCTALALGVTGCSVPLDSKHPHHQDPKLIPHHNNLPPAAMLMHPGPGVDGPGPGVMLAGHHRPIGPAMGPGCFPGGEMGEQGSSQVAFLGPDGMTVAWDVGAVGQFDSEPLVAPGRFNFTQGAIYRLKLANIPGRPGIELYPTLEVGPTMPRTAAYLDHNAIPFQLTEEDFDQVLSGNFVTKVIYLPDAEYQELALAGVETLVSTRLDPGMDPIVEADRRGSIMAIIRIGNKDFQVGNGVNGQIIRTSYPGTKATPAGFKHHAGAACDPGCEGGYCGAPSPYIAGMTAPEYGMPITGTPIGLPGPPHIPLGVPAGLQRHEITNHTKVKLPGPTENVEIHVKQKPGLSYPQPANKVHIVEKTHSHVGPYHQPLSDKHQRVPGSVYVDGNCDNGQCQTGDCP